MAAAKIGGAPGEKWTNDTGKVKFQLVVNWQNSCGQCIALDHAIRATKWPIPLHRNCRCMQLSIYPGETALPFVDFAAQVDALPASQQGRVVGVAALKLIQSGTVKWKDVVTPAGIRSLADVVRARGLTVDRLVGAGVTRGVAARAHAAARGTTPVPPLGRVVAAEARAGAQALAEAKAKAQAAAAAKVAARQADLEVRARLKAEQQARAQAIRQAAATAAAAGWTPARTLAEAEAWGAARGVKAINAVSLADWNAVNAEVAKLPPSVLDTIARADKRLDILSGQGITDHPELARFKGVTPRGWEGTGRTWDDIPGSGGSLQYDATVIVANRLDVGHASMNLVLHEHGHTYDASLQKLTGTKGSDTPKWRALHAATTWETAYLKIPEEGYVESMARYLHSDLSRAQLPQPVRDYWDGHFGAEASRASAAPTGAGATAKATKVKTKPAPTPSTQTEAKVDAFRVKFEANRAASDAKVAEILEAGSTYAERTDALAARRAELEAATGSLKGTKGAARKAVEARIAAASDGVYAASKDLKAAEGRTRHNVLHVLTAAGAPLEIGHNDTVKDLPEAVQGPAEGALAWLGRVVAAKGDTAGVKFGFRTLANDPRAYYQAGSIFLSGSEEMKTVVHELGHMLDQKVPGWNDTAQAFLRHRVGDEPLTQMRSLKLPQTKFDADEYGRKDRFDEAFGDLGWYVGKDYGQYSSEVTAMGLEMLFTDPVTFARKDPEYASFIIGMLSGDLR